MIRKKQAKLQYEHVTFKFKKQYFQKKKFSLVNVIYNIQLCSGNLLLFTLFVPQKNNKQFPFLSKFWFRNHSKIMCLFFKYHFFVLTESQKTKQQPEIIIKTYISIKKIKPFSGSVRGKADIITAPLAQINN